MTFFQDYPVPPSPPQQRAVRYVPPPWAGPPAYELPSVVHLGQFLHRNPSAVMAIKSAEVFSAGCSFNMSWVIRRGIRNDDEWGEMHSLFFQHGPVTGHRTDQLSMLMFGVEFPDGSKAITGNRGPHAFLGDAGQEPEPPTLVLANSGGGGGGDELAGTGTLWLWPLPPAGNLRLVAQWKDFGMEETSVVLDGGQLRDAAAGVQQFWPEEESQ